VGSQSQDKQDRIIYNKKTGALSYDQDGTGSSKAVHFATLTNKANLEFTDLWVI
jgi:Ca2+-binding RTX toxin-like protein